MDNINCKKCKYYYITWDKIFPNGCRKLGFKSKALPCLEVYKASGQNCLYFEKDNKHKE